MDVTVIEDRKCPLNAHDHALFILLELKGKRMVDGAAAYAELFDRQTPPIFASLEAPGPHCGHPNSGPS